MNIPLMCEMLVDQDRFIGSDPIGHKCSNNAVDSILVEGRYYLVCSTCLEMDRERLTLPPLGGGATPAEAYNRAHNMVKTVAESLLQNSKRAYGPPEDRPDGRP